jgi:hypothetical protein
MASANLGWCVLEGKVVPVLKHHNIYMYGEDKVQDHTLTLEVNGQLHSLLALCTGKSLIPATQESEM